MAGLAVPFAQDARQRLGLRATSLVLVILLHLLLLLSLLTGLVQPVTRARLMRELTFVLPPLPKAKPSPEAGVATAPVRRPAPPPPLYRMPEVAPPVPDAAPDLQSLGRSLFGCAPQRYAQMTQEERAHCPPQFAMPDPSHLADPPSQVQDPVRRQAELAAKNRPLRIPCAVVMEERTIYGTRAAPGFDPLCVALGLLNGFGPITGLPP